MKLELTRAEIQTLLVAIGDAIEKESHVIERLTRGVLGAGQLQDISERRRHLRALEDLRKRLTGTPPA